MHYAATNTNVTALLSLYEELCHETNPTRNRRIMKTATNTLQDGEDVQMCACARAYPKIYLSS